MVLDTPFDIRPYHFTLKPEKRSVPAVGAAIAAAVHDTAGFGCLVDGSGLGNADSDRLLEHDTDTGGMWITKSDTAGDGLEFELSRESQIGSILIWNYNRPAYTDMGVQKADISVWTANGGWQTVLRDAVLQEAEGSDDYDEPTVLTFDPVSAQKVRFENLTAFNPKAGRVGLSEIRFYEPLGRAACNPEPVDGGQAACLETIDLLWTPGREAVAHDVYIGETAEALTCLGRVKGLPPVAVSGLAGGCDYVWRIDEVDKNGAVEMGSPWRLHVRGGQVAHWTLDETCEDALGQFPGRLSDQPSWQAGQYGQAVYLDGQADYIEVPALNLRTNTLTMCGWINPQDLTSEACGVLFCRTDHTVAGIHLSVDTLRYHWNDLIETYNWVSGLTVPKDRWVFVALTVTPQKATLYLYDPQTDELQSAENPIAHTPEEFDGPFCIGRDSGFGDRYYEGMVDDVQIFDYPLSRAQIDQVRRQQPVAFDRSRPVTLVNADLVRAGESLAAIAAEQADLPAAGKKKNWIAVAVIVLVIAGFAAISALRKKKAA